MKSILRIILLQMKAIWIYTEGGEVYFCMIQETKE